MNQLEERSFFIWDKKAVVLFMLMVSHPALVIALSAFSGLHSFESSGLVNKIWFCFVVVLLFPVIISIFLKPGVYVFIVSFFSIYGLALGNPLLSVISDFSLFILPYVFFRYWISVGCLEIQLRVIYQSLMLVALFCVFVLMPAKVLGISFYFDYVLILSFAISGLLLKHHKRILFLIASFSVPISKTLLVGLVLGLVFAYKTSLKYKFILVLSVGLALWLLFNIGNRDVLEFVEVVMNFNVVVTNFGFSSFYSPFEYFDVSTAHRIYEVVQIFEVNFSNFVVFLLGQGFGGGVDLSYSDDSSVAVSRSFSDLTSVRVIHLGLASIFLKFGLLGSVVVLYMIVKWGRALYRARSDEFLGHNLLIMLRLSFAMYLIGCFFTFSNYFKQPGFGIVLAIIYMQFIAIDKFRLNHKVS